MKKGLIICAFAIGAIGAFAFAPGKAEVKAKSGDDLWHYFDANTDEYLGQRTAPQQQVLCGTPQDNPCAEGYSSTTVNEDNEIIPVGSAMSHIKKPN